MARVLARLRGGLLRLARRRALAIALGGALAFPAFWIEISGRSRHWWVDGLSLIACATGTALFWTGLTGIRPDWIDREEQ